MSTISMTRMLKAIDFYKNIGYKLIDVPQCIDIEVSGHTKPKGFGDLHHKGGKVYVASAEQSFIQLHNDGVLHDGKYMAITPCYREEPVLDETHYTIFLKLELIVIGSKSSHNVMSDALSFMNKLTNGKALSLNTEEGIHTYDIVFNDIEIGSYGVRSMLDGTYYVYGTGLAEPRMSYVLDTYKI